MREIADFDGSLVLEEGGYKLTSHPEHQYIEFSTDNEEYNDNEGVMLFLDYSEAELLYRMLERSLLFLSHQGG